MLELSICRILHRLILGVPCFFNVLLVVDGLNFCPFLDRRHLRDYPLLDFIVSGLSASLASFAPIQEDAAFIKCWQFGIGEQTFVVPFQSKLFIHICIFIAVRKDEHRVERGQVANGILADSHYILVIDGRPIAAFEQDDAKGEWLRLHMLIAVEPLHPVDRGDARVIQARSVNQIEALQLVADGVLSDSLDLSASLE